MKLSFATLVVLLTLGAFAQKPTIELGEAVRLLDRDVERIAWSPDSRQVLITQVGARPYGVGPAWALFRWSPGETRPTELMRGQQIPGDVEPVLEGWLSTGPTPVLSRTGPSGVELVSLNLSSGKVTRLAAFPAGQGVVVYPTDRDYVVVVLRLDALPSDDIDRPGIPYPPGERPRPSTELRRTQVLTVNSQGTVGPRTEISPRMVFRGVTAEGKGVFAETVRTEGQRRATETYTLLDFGTGLTETLRSRPEVLPRTDPDARPGVAQMTLMFSESKGGGNRLSVAWAADPATSRLVAENVETYALSPDGAHIAFVKNGELWVRPVRTTFAEKGGGNK